jgi:flavin reductase (DIM6/NTAB) family NADH-FMN oxidoreductase RutF
MQQDEFRQALSRFASGVTVITVQHGEIVHGMTATAFFSLSLDPPLIAVGVSQRARLHGLLPLAGCFGINVLAEDQLSLSHHFAGAPQPELRIPFQHCEVPLVDGALVHIVCRLRDVCPGGDHTLYIGEVTRVTGRPGKPLLYFGGRYCCLDEIAAATVGETR